MLVSPMSEYNHPFGSEQHITKNGKFPHPHQLSFFQQFLPFLNLVWINILGDFVDLIGVYSMSLLRAMITCCIPMSDFGKVYAVFTAMENLIPIGVTQVYAIVWEVSACIGNFKFC